MYASRKGFPVFASDSKISSISIATYSSPLWAELEQMAALGHLPAFGHQGYCDQKKSFAAVRHCHGRLIYALTGDMLVVVKAESIRVRAKSAFWIPPLIRHELKVDAGTMFNTIYINVLLASHLPPVSWRFSASPLLEQISNSLSDTPLGSEVTRRNMLLTGVLIDEVNNSRLTSI